MPIKAVAEDLGLPLHQIDSFRPWRTTKTYNLLVTVSFGLLVPKKVLEAAKYGGLNVHPSLLPDLRGAAPIEHALLKRREVTGVSLQTMHPTKFDHGVVLAQSEEVPIRYTSRHYEGPQQLQKKLRTLGAGLLRKGIEEAIFVPPLQDARAGMPDPLQIDPAPKITPQDRQIDWKTWTADEIQFRDIVLGQLWDTQTFPRCFEPQAAPAKPKRITFIGPWSKIESEQHAGSMGEPQLIRSGFHNGLSLGIKTVDGCVVAPRSATIEGRSRGTGVQALTEQIRQRIKATGKAAKDSTTNSGP